MRVAGWWRRSSQRHGARALAAIVVVSHAHADHLGGVPSRARRGSPPGVVIEPGAPVADPAYYAAFSTSSSTRAGMPWHPARAGRALHARRRALHGAASRPGWADWGEDVNEDSLVLLVEYGDFQALFAGDAGFPAEAACCGRAPAGGPAEGGPPREPRQHRRRAGSTALRPAVAVISVGRNDYGHPSPETLARLRAPSSAGAPDRPGRHGQCATRMGRRCGSTPGGVS